MLSQRDKGEVEALAELQVRRYFDDYLQNTLPTTLQQVVKSHDDSADAHKGVSRRVDRLLWVLLTGAVAGGGAAGFGLDKLLSAI